jgi:WD40 repeat protein
LWNTEAGIELQRFEGISLVQSIPVSSDNKRIALVSNENICIFDLETGYKSLKVEGKFNGALSFSPDGQHLACHYDNAIRILDPKNGNEKIKLVGSKYPGRSVTFSPDSRLIASAFKAIRIWDTNTGNELCKLEGHSEIISSISFSPDGKCLASASRDCFLGIWDMTGIVNTQVHTHIQPPFLSKWLELQAATLGFRKTQRIEEITNDFKQPYISETKKKYWVPNNLEGGNDEGCLGILQPKKRFFLPFRFSSIVLDGYRLFSASPALNLYSWNLKRGGYCLHWNLPSIITDVEILPFITDIALSHDCRYLFLANNNDRYYCLGH